MYELRVSRREGDICHGEVLNKILIRIEPDPVVLVGFVRKRTVVFPVTGSKEDDGLGRILAEFTVNIEKRRRVGIEHLVALKTQFSLIRIVDKTRIVLVAVAREKNIDHLNALLLSDCTKTQTDNTILHYKT